MRFTTPAAAMFFALATAGAGAQGLPIKKGFFVANVPCAKASFGTISRYDGGTTMMIGHAACKLKILGQIGTIWRVESDCYVERDDSNIKQIQQYDIANPTSYTVKTEFGTFRNRYCAANELPEPWGTRRR